MGSHAFSTKRLDSFVAVVWEYYRANPRSLPWRASVDPYRILVSEVMLQQTQATRVIEKYKTFLDKFPTLEDLAASTPADVLREWAGLGYNGRALRLQAAAAEIVRVHGGVVPQDVGLLTELPGIGEATAAAIAVYAYNIPHVFIETNIRAVYIHAFFSKESDVKDERIRELVSATLNRHNPREWYWALMDYGVYLKKKYGNPARSSALYKRQSTFEGSVRQARGAVVRLLLARGPLDKEQIKKEISLDEEKIEMALSALEREGTVKRIKNSYTIQ